MSSHDDVVQGIKDGLVAAGVDLSGPCGAFEITKRAAWAFKVEGAGLLAKPNGNNCQGYSTDYVVYKTADGISMDGYDILRDAGGANIPQWSGPETGMDPDLWRAPIDPGDVVPGAPPTPTPQPPDPPLPWPTPDYVTRAEFEAYKVKAQDAANEALDIEVASLERQIAALQTRIDRLVNGGLIVSGDTSRKLGHAHTVNLLVKPKP